MNVRVILLVFGYGIFAGVHGTCPDPPSIQYGKVICEDENQRGSNCTVECDVGYRLSNSNKQQDYIACREDGNWDKLFPKCIEKCPPKADVVFVLDFSTSTKGRGRKMMRMLLQKFVKGLNISEDGINVAAVPYNREVTEDKVVHLNNYTDDKDALLKSLRKLGRPMEGSHTGKALDYVSEVILATENGNRDDAPDVVIVMSDGRGRDNIDNHLNSLWGSGVTTYAVGFHPRNNLEILEERLLKIAQGDPSRVHITDKEPGKTAIYELADQLGKAYCVESVTRCRVSTSLAPMNGTVSCTNYNKVGSTCTFQCDEGFIIIGESEANCEAKKTTNEWNVEFPVCAPRCQELFTENGNVVCSSGNDVGSMCTFECESGYFLTGEPDTNCLELQVGSAWNPPPPKCVDRESDLELLKRTFPESCSPPQPFPPRNGSVFCTNANEIGSVCTFICQDGFIQEGDPFTSCLKTGKAARWTMASASCVERCTATKDITPTHGGITCSEQGELGSECIFHCDEGYFLEGSDTTACIRTGNGLQWSFQPPRCIPRCAPELPQAPNDGGVICSSGNEIGSECTFYCDDGYYIDGPTTTECREMRVGAIWSHEKTPTCVLRCPPDTPVDPDHGYKICSGSNRVGAVCTFMCDFGYTMHGTARIECRRARTGARWSAEPPTCSATCYPTLPVSPVNGFATCTDGNEIGSMCTYRCEDGFILSGQENTECVSRGTGAIWSSETPICQETCRPALFPPYKGVVSCSRDSEMGSVCHVSCEDGLSLKGSGTIACIDRGEGPVWSSEMPICVPECATSLSRPENGEISCSHGNQLGSECLFSCYEDHTLVGDEQVSCVERGDRVFWNSVTPTCIADCSPLDATFSNGYLSCSEGSRVGSSCFAICQTGYELVGASTIECVASAGFASWNARLPVCRALCSPTTPAAPRYGKVGCTDGNELGSVCTFECDTGYNLVGFGSTVCLQKSQGASWSRQTPFCVAKCGDSPPTAPAKGSVFCTNSNELGSVCTYTCFQGHIMDGEGTSVCVKNRRGALWSSEQPTCIPTCGNSLPEAPRHGRVNCTRRGRLGSVCSFNCDKGHTLVGKSRMECIRRGNGARWTSAPPVCNARCNPAVPAHPENGDLLCSNGNEKGSVCKFQCGPNFKLVGDEITTCVDEGVGAAWSSESPVCAPTCQPAKLHAPANGNIECTDENNLRSTCSFSCENRYDLVGDETVVCAQRGAGASWTSSPPGCIARCTKTETLLVNNGTVSCTDSNEIGSLCSFGCDAEYTLAGSDTARCAEQVIGAAWSTEKPRCNPRCARHPRFMRRGQVSCTNGKELGSVCTFECDDGFAVEGESEIECVEENFKARWNYPLPKCIARCPPLTSLTRGQISCSRENEIGSWCSFICDRVYVLTGEGTARCVEQEDGASWSNPPPSCEARCRPMTPPPPTNGVVVCNKKNEVDSVCTFRCERGFTMFGSSTTTCTENFIGATWNKKTPTCIATCGDEPTNPPNGGNITCTKGSAVGSICLFTCDQEYTLVGSNRMRCIERSREASWDVKPPSCVRKCDPAVPQAPRHGSISCNKENEIGSICTYTCDPTYSISGSRKTRCVRQGIKAFWDEPTPRCIGDCSRISTIVPRNARVMCSDSNKAGSVCTFQCDNGLSLAGNRRTVCLDDGDEPKWSEESPECVAPCFPLTPKSPRNGGLACTDRNQVGSACTFRCNAGYQLDGDLWTTCRSINGKSSWGEAKPTCVVRCASEPDEPRNGRVTCTRGSKLRSVCTFKCNQGFKLVGSIKATCLKLRKTPAWNKPTPNCLPICTEPAGLTPQHGRVTCTKQNAIGSICRFTCDEGYEMEGDARATCERELGGASWNSSPPSCVARCPPLPKSSNLLISSCSDGNNVGSVCSFQCQPSSELVGADAIFCVHRGASRGGGWSRPPPSCIEICDPAVPAAPENGAVSCTDTNRINSVCAFECAEGLYLNGQAKTECVRSNDTMQWDNETPQCIVKCPGLPSIRPQNGDVFCTNSNHIGSICSFECGIRYNLIGDITTNCMEDGSWDTQPPICEPKCFPRTPRAPKRGSVNCNDSNHIGSACKFECDPGLTVKGSKLTTCTKVGASSNWDMPVPECSETCPTDTPPVPRNAIVSCDDGNFAGSFCTFGCREGYALQQRGKAVCQARKTTTTWRRAIVRCIEKCPVMKNPRFGAVTCTDGNNIRSTCAFSCGTGFTMIGAPEITCNPRGLRSSWSAQPPTCHGGCIPEVLKAPENGRVVCTDSNNVESTCSFQCDQGFSPVGDRTSRCTYNDSGIFWTKASMQCVQEKCFPPRELLQHGNVSCTDQNNVGSVCKFTCTKDSYKLYPEDLDTNVCKDKIGTSVNDWSGAVPCCAQQCPPKAKMDAVIALDSSSSIGAENWNTVKTFIENIIRAFEVSSESANFAVFRYNAEVDRESEIMLKDYPYNKFGLIQAFRKIPYSGSGTHTGKAMTHILENVLTKEAGNRPDVADVVIVVTDGKAADDLSTPAQLLRDAGVEIYVIGIVPPRGRLDLDQLRELSGDESNIQIVAGGFQQLNSQFARQIAGKVCGNPCQR